MLGANLYPLVEFPIWSQFVGLMKLGLTTLANVTGSPGLAIIIFTVLIKLLLTPLTLRTIKSQRAMQDLQPKIKALQKRFGSDRQKLSAETMRLYQEHNVNPTASCLPILFQLPIFWGLYQSLTQLSNTAGGPFQQSFLWLTSLGAPDALHIMPFVAAFFQLLQTRMSMPTGKFKSTDPQQKMMTQMMQFLPITVIFFGWSFPSGLVLYWATQSVFGAVQQYWITGWGALREWLPFLPEVVRYTPPDPDAIDESRVIVTGADGERPVLKQRGLMGLISKQIEKVEQQRVAAEAAGAGETATTVKASGARTNGANGADATSRPRVTVQNSKNQRKQARAADDDLDEIDDDDAQTAAAPAPRVSVKKTGPAADRVAGNGATPKRRS
ncbi:MAG TPA: YidC/Oxa1 family membrane protein insertase [Thermomicrobiales bacterium]